MEQFHALQVSDIRRETPSSASVAFIVPDELKDFYQFRAGQYLTFRTIIDGEDIRRSYSVCVAPTDNELRVAVKHLSGGVFSTFVNEHLKVGDTIEVGAPEGRFCQDFNPNKSRRYVAFAAGSGITPVLSLMRMALAVESESSFTLFYGNRGSVDIMFLDGLSTLKDIYPERLSIYHILSREESEFPILSGRLDAPRIQELLTQFVPEPAFVERYFICGPEAMMDAAETELSTLGVTTEAICIERFGATLSDDEKAKLAERVEQAAGAMMAITQDGRRIQVPFRTEAGNVLDAVRAAGLPAPFSCKGGVCATCRAKITEGKVEMAIHYGLTDDEIARGHILTCQAVPITDKVSITYDV